MYQYQELNMRDIDELQEEQRNGKAPSRLHKKVSYLTPYQNKVFDILKEASCSDSNSHMLRLGLIALAKQLDISELDKSYFEQAMLESDSNKDYE